MTISKRSAQALFTLAAAPLVVATARRVAWLDRELAFDELVAALRDARRRPLPQRWRRPERLAAAVERLVGWLPPRRYGRCLRRALLLLELWSRCGIEPALHLELVGAAPDPDGHAWLTARDGRGAALAVSAPHGHGAAFEL